VEGSGHVATPVRLRQDWRYRDTNVPGHGLMRVPRYVVRIDQEGRRPGATGTHGWQVRYTKPWRLFSDSMYAARKDRLGPRPSPVGSLKAAVAYLGRLWDGDRPQRLRPESPAKRIQTGLAGVYVVWEEPKMGRVARCFVRADRYNGATLKRLYVGTKSTATPARLEQCIERAKRLRVVHLQSLGVQVPDELLQGL
jgi:hypothetical protein